MKASEIIKNLQELIEKHGDLDVCYSKDDEGNGFENIHYEPSVGNFEDSEFLTLEQFKDWDKDESDMNYICIN